MVRSEGNMSLKNPVTPPGIDPGTVRLVAQRLNHYATPGPIVRRGFAKSVRLCKGYALLDIVRRNDLKPNAEVSR